MTQRKPYNYNTKDGRRKLREQADYKYQTGTPEYRQSKVGGNHTIQFQNLFTPVELEMLLNRVNRYKDLLDRSYGMDPSDNTLKIMSDDNYYLLGKGIQGIIGPGVPSRLTKTQCRIQAL